jgi:hypothetical protein
MVENKERDADGSGTWNIMPEAVKDILIKGKEFCGTHRRLQRDYLLDVKY